jgi:hypothetical protein
MKREVERGRVRYVGEGRSWSVHRGLASWSKNLVTGVCMGNVKEDGDLSS